MPQAPRLRKPELARCNFQEPERRDHIYKYIYIYVCIYMCICIYVCAGYMGMMDKMMETITI